MSSNWQPLCRQARQCSQPARRRRRPTDHAVASIFVMVSTNTPHRLCLAAETRRPSCEFHRPEYSSSNALPSDAMNAPYKANAADTAAFRSPTTKIPDQAASHDLSTPMRCNTGMNLVLPSYPWPTLRCVTLVHVCMSEPSLGIMSLLDVIWTDSNTWSKSSTRNAKYARHCGLVARSSRTSVFAARPSRLSSREGGDRVETRKGWHVCPRCCSPCPCPPRSSHCRPTMKLPLPHYPSWCWSRR